MRCGWIKMYWLKLTHLDPSYCFVFCQPYRVVLWYVPIPSLSPDHTPRLYCFGCRNLCLLILGTSTFPSTFPGPPPPLVPPPPPSPPHTPHPPPSNSSRSCGGRPSSLTAPANQATPTRASSLTTSANQATPRATPTGPN